MYFLGLDLGQKRDYSALIAVEREHRDSVVGRVREIAGNPAAVSGRDAKGEDGGYVRTGIHVRVYSERLVETAMDDTVTELSIPRRW